MEVAYEEPGRQLFYPALNVSASGIFLGTNETPDLGAYVRIVFSLPPDGVFVRTRGQVVRHASAGEPAGFAVAFRDLDAASRSELQAFVDGPSPARA